MGRLHAGNLRRDHRNRKAGPANRLDRGGKIGLHAFRQNVTTGANRQVNAIESNIPRDGSGLSNAGPLQVLGEDTNLQLRRRAVRGLDGIFGECTENSGHSSTHQQRTARHLGWFGIAHLVRSSWNNTPAAKVYKTYGVLSLSKLHGNGGVKNACFFKRPGGRDCWCFERYRSCGGGALRAGGSEGRGGCAARRPVAISQGGTGKRTARHYCAAC